MIQFAHLLTSFPAVNGLLILGDMGFLKAKAGGEWSEDIRLIHNVEGSTTETFTIKPNELCKYLQEDAEIVKITLCRTHSELLMDLIRLISFTNLVDVLMTKDPFEVKEDEMEKIINEFDDVGHHAYVVLQAGERYISFDKHSTGITVQISDKEDFVKKKIANEDRKKSEFTNKADEINFLDIVSKSDKRIKDLISLLITEDVFNAGYHLLSGNHCKQFAALIFNHFTKDKDIRYEWKIREISFKKKIYQAWVNVFLKRSE